VVVATNVAESSVTIADVVHVIDTGLVKVRARRIARVRVLTWLSQ
jgi:HrpA-like RNA helicase